MINIDGAGYLDVQEAAAQLGVKPETLYAYVSRGLLRSYKQGIRRRRLYLLSEIEALLSLRPPDARTTSGEPSPGVDQPTPGEDDRPAPAPGPTALPSAEGWAAER